MRSLFFRSLVVSVGLAVALVRSASAQTPPAASPDREEVERLRSELAALRQDYAERLAALDQRLSALEGTAPEPPPSPPPPAVPAASEAQVAPGAAGAGGPAGTLPVYGGAAASSKIFNPDIAVIGNFLGAAGSSPGGLQPALQIQEVEVSFQAVVDPYARADFIFTYGPEEVGIEEAYATFPTLPGGLLAKAGIQRDVFGKVDPLHTHNLPFADRPQVTQNLTGGDDGLANPGVGVARLIPNPWVFLEATGQLFGGANLVFDAPQPSDVSFVGHLRAYHDLRESSNLEVGSSFAYGHNDTGPGNYTRLLGADVTFRYRPLRRAIYRRFLGRAEAVWSRREEPGGARDAFGFYVQGEHQFARRWYVAGRYDYSGRAAFPEIVDKGGSLAVTFWPSEFSQLRGQYHYIRGTDGLTTSEFLFQLQFAIGAHGAHPF